MQIEGDGVKYALASAIAHTNKLYFFVKWNGLLGNGLALPIGRDFIVLRANPVLTFAIVATSTALE